MKLFRRVLLALLALVVVAYVGAIGYFYFNQRSFQYFPQMGSVIPIASTKLTDAIDVAFPTTDGATVHGWYAPAQPGLPTIMFCKGNWGTFTDEHERYEAWNADGYGFLAFDYRGFPATPGDITQQHVLDDALAAYDWLKAKGGPIVLWGRSLGSGPCTYVASQRAPDALLLETPFLSAADVAGDRYPYMPVNWLVLDQFPVKRWILDVKAPVFVAHGNNDHTIDGHHGSAVYALAPNKYDLWVVDGADHSDLWARAIWPKARAFYTDVESRLHAVGG